MIVNGKETEIVELEGIVTDVSIDAPRENKNHPDYAPAYLIRIAIANTSDSKTTLIDGVRAAIMIGRKMYMPYIDAHEFSMPYIGSSKQGCENDVILSAYTQRVVKVVDSEGASIDASMVCRGDKARIAVSFRPKKPENGTGVAARLHAVMLVEHENYDDEVDYVFLPYHETDDERMPF